MAPLGPYVNDLGRECLVIAPQVVPFLCTPFRKMAPLGIKGKLKRQSEVVKMKHQVLRKSISGRVLPGLPPQKLTAIFGVPSRPATRPEMYRYTLNILLILPFLFILGLLTTHDTSALSYQSNTGVQFTINPTITLSVSGDLIINDLTPGNSSDSNIVTVTASSNAVAGYGLYSTVGNSTNNSTELRKDGTDTTNKFSSITTNKTSLSDFNGSDWGYSYSTDSGSTWISGNTGSTSTGYNGLPLYTNTGIKLVDTATSGSTTISFKIGAKASNSQIAGDYTNTINFIGVAKPNPTTFVEAFAAAGKQKYNGYYKMQDMTSSICIAAEQGSNIQLIDIRDNEVYMIAKLKDDNCWMLDNLRLDLTNANVLNGLTVDNTNVDEASLISLRQGNRAAGDRYATSGFSSSWDNYYTAPRINTNGSVVKGENYNTWTGNYTKDTVAPVTYGNGSGKIGIYYNYCAASAGNYCYGSGIDDPSTLQDAQYDLCPKGWRMPTSTGDGEYAILYTAYGDNAANFKDALSTPLSGGYYSNTAFFQGSEGRFWSATWVDATGMWACTLSRSNVSSSILPSNPFGRFHGISVRCLLDS